jgi:hypothetical protein
LNEFKVKGAVSANSIHEIDWLLPLDLPGNPSNDGLDLEHGFEYLDIGTTVFAMRRGTVVLYNILTQFLQSSAVIAHFA